MPSIRGGDPDGPERAICPCCGLLQPTCVDAAGVTARVCAMCTHHQGEQDSKRLSRAEKHEEMLRKRLEACRASESQAQADAAKARKARTVAFRSRGWLASRLVQAADRNGNHHCAVQAIAREPDVDRWARWEDEDDRW